MTTAAAAAGARAGGRAAAARSRVRYRLLPPSPAAAPPGLDPRQRTVADHGAGPLLVLAGPGTGKTTTLVESVVTRLERGDATADQILVLTFSRRAAEDLRGRLAARLAGSGVAAPAAWTFHAWCYALLRAHQPADAWETPLHLLSGAEQDVVVRELIAGRVELGRSWPAALRAAVGTRGLAEEVSGLLARARALGMDPVDLDAAGRAAGRDDWRVLASFYEEYLTVLDAQGALDYAELVRRAAVLSGRAEVATELRGRYRAVYVDEYQDTDPGQVQLLRHLAGDGATLVAFGDPDQSIYRFRGADVRGILDFPEQFPTAAGRPAPTVALQNSRRSGVALLAASRRVAAGLPAAGARVADLRRLRALEPDTALPAGQVEAVTALTATAQARYIADVLGREHLEQGTPWSQMAVLVRSTATSLPVLRRVLSSAGIPVAVSEDEVPLARHPAVAVLLSALHCADAFPAPGDTGDGPARAGEVLTPETVHALLAGPLVAASPTTLRRLGRALRALDAEERPAGSDPADGAPAVPPVARSAAELIRDAVLDPRLLLLVDSDVARPARRLAALLGAAAAVLRGGGEPEEALWALWRDSGWGARLSAASRGGAGVPSAADRDLDAVVALFRFLSRVSERTPHRGVGSILASLQAQQIPGDAAAERGVVGGGVRVLTAHRSKGLEWDVVVVADVQEGSWPDLRARGSLLSPERLVPQGQPAQPLTRSELLADERRLFYVAVTRARRRLLVTAVAADDDTEDRPSRFLDELGVPVRPVRPERTRSLTLPSTVATLRRWAQDPAGPPAVRAAAVRRLAALAALTADVPADGGEHRAPPRRLAPAADPATWWGTAPRTVAPLPLLDPAAPVPLSGSQLAGLQDCPLQWFYERQARAAVPSAPYQAFGSLLHALAHLAATGGLTPDPAALEASLDTVWGRIGYDTPWHARQRRQDAATAIARLVAWLERPTARQLLGSELEFRVEVPTPAGPVLLRGSFDRVELDVDGRPVVVDFKTSKSVVTLAEAEANPQLGLYQRALLAGAVELPSGAPSDAAGGGELVFLQVEQGTKQPHLPKERSQSTLATGWVDELLTSAAETVRAERFPARPNDRCERCAFVRACPAQPEGRSVLA
ncbi:MAG TPA: ATP-dependent DNA helicase [Frankiaceae bacterium]